MHACRVISAPKGGSNGDLGSHKIKVPDSLQSLYEKKWPICRWIKRESMILSIEFNWDPDPNQELRTSTDCGNTMARTLLAGWSLGLILSLWSPLGCHLMTKCNLMWDIRTLPAQRVKPLATPLLLLHLLLLVVSQHPGEVLVQVEDLNDMEMATWDRWPWKRRQCHNTSLVIHSVSVSILSSHTTPSITSSCTATGDWTAYHYYNAITSVWMPLLREAHSYLKSNDWVSHTNKYTHHKTQRSTDPNDQRKNLRYRSAYRQRTSLPDTPPRRHDSSRNSVH